MKSTMPRPSCSSSSASSQPGSDLLVPAGRNPRDASSSTSTQSFAAPQDGGVNSIPPLGSNSPADLAAPVRGSNHQALIVSPLSLFNAIVAGLPVGKYTIAYLPSTSQVATTRSRPCCVSSPTSNGSGTRPRNGRDAPLATSAALESAMSSTICRHGMSDVLGSGAGDEVGASIGGAEAIGGNDGNSTDGFSAAHPGLTWYLSSLCHAADRGHDAADHSPSACAGW